MRLILRPWHLVLALALTLAYRFALLEHSGISLYIDEAYYWGWAQEPAWGYYSKPPMIAWLISLSTALFGSEVWGVKALAMAMFPLTAWMVYLIGRDLFNAQTGLMAALLWNFSFTCGLLGLFATTDALLLFFWSAAIWWTWRALERPQAFNFVALGVVLALGVLSKYTMLAFGLAVPWLLWDLWRRHGRIPAVYWRGGLITLATMALLLAPHVHWSITQGMPTLRHTVDITVQAGDIGGWPKLLEFWASQFLMISPLPLGYLLWRWVRDRGLWAPATVALPSGVSEVEARRAASFLGTLALGLLLVCSIQAFNARANMNWAAPAFVPLALLFSATALRRGAMAAAWWRNLWVLGVLLNALMVTVIVHAKDIAAWTRTSLPAQWDVFVRMRGWDALYEQVQAQAQAQAHASLPVLGYGRNALAHAVYHWRERTVQPLAWNPNGRLTDHYMLISDLSQWKGRDMLYVDYYPIPQEISARFQRVQPLAQASVSVAPDRVNALYLYRLEGFKGYRD